MIAQRLFGETKYNKSKHVDLVKLLPFSIALKKLPTSPIRCLKRYTLVEVSLISTQSGH